MRNIITRPTTHHLLARSRSDADVTALTLALVNSGNGITALYVLLTSAGFVLFMMYPVRWTYGWLARRTGCLETGQPSNTMMTLTLLIVFIAAFFTDVIGVHPIFGASVTCSKTIIFVTNMTVQGASWLALLYLTKTAMPSLSWRSSKILCPSSFYPW